MENSSFKKLLAVLSILSFCFGGGSFVFSQNIATYKELILQSEDYGAISLMSDSVAVYNDMLIATGQDAYGSKKLFVFKKHFGGINKWGLLAKMNAEATGLAISDIAIDQDIIVTSSMFDSQFGSSAGLVRVYVRDASSSNGWGLEKVIAPPDVSLSLLFGWRTAVNGDYVAVTTRGTNSVYLFGRDINGQGQWGLIKEFVGPAVNQFSDASVDISCDRLVIGASASLSNSVFVYERNTGGPDQWGLVKEVFPSLNVANSFGSAVSIDGPLLAVGAYTDDEQANNAGAAYIFARNFGGADNWGQVKKIIPDSLQSSLFLGRSVNLRRDKLICSADGYFTTATSSGAAFLYSRNQGGAENWGETERYISENTSALSQPLFNGVALGSGFAAASTANSFATNIISGVRIFNGYDCDSWMSVWTNQPSPGSSEGVRKYGRSVSIDRDIMAISSTRYDDLSYLIIRERNAAGADGWGVIKTINGDGQEDYGAVISLSCDRLAVGVPLANGVANLSGHVEVRERNVGGGDNWGIAAVIYPPAGNSQSHFGESLALDNDTMVIGAPSALDYGVSLHGKAWVAIRDGVSSNGWNLLSLLPPYGLSATSKFGDAVSIDGNRVAVGAPGHVSSANNFRGAVYIGEEVERGVTWSIVQELTVPGNTNGFAEVGASVSLSGDFLAVGVPGYEYNGISTAGAVYIFECNRISGEWEQKHQVVSPVPVENGEFGGLVSLSGEHLAVGQTGSGSPMLYTFDRNQGGADNWGLQQEIISLDAGASSFPSDIEIDGDRLLIGGSDISSTQDSVVLYEFKEDCKIVTTYSDIVTNDNLLSLREAINEANTCTATVYTVLLPAGTYLLNRTGAGENANDTGDLDITNTTCKIIIQGHGADKTIIDGNGTDRIIDIFSGADVEIHDVAMRNGRVDDGDPGVGVNDGGNGRSGGGIVNRGQLLILRCSVSTNSAGDGGVAELGQGTVAGSGGRGGGILNNGTLTLRKSALVDNMAGRGGLGDNPGYGGDGGGVYNQDGASFTAVNCTFYFNRSGDAGPGGSGSGISGDGGAVWSGDTATVNLRHNTFYKNYAGAYWVEGRGGAIYALSTIDPFVFNILSMNQAVISAQHIDSAVNDPAYNIIENTNGLLVTGIQLGNIIAPAQLGVFQNNLGTTSTAEPLFGSPAINGGSATYSNVSGKDQRGFPRPVSGLTYDIGAVEVTEDFDGDGIPDADEVAVGTDPENGKDEELDNDLDDFSVYEEYMADTNPDDGNSYFRIFSLKYITGGTNLVGVTNSSPNRYYSLEVSTNLSDNSIWMPIAGSINVTGSSTGVTTWLSQTNISSDLNFYRVMVRP